jgi:hypothetical protein
MAREQTVKQRAAWRDYRPSTLRLSLPAGYTLVLAAVFVAIYVLLIEAVLRVPAIRSRLPAPSVGSNYLSFEIALERLDRFASEGPIDCAFLGSSLVLRGVDPAIFGEAYARQTGSAALRCFNFGIQGMSASAVGIAAEYLVDAYHPRLLIYGFSPRAFGQSVLDRSLTGDTLRDLAWARQVQGDFNLEGWLYRYSGLYRYRWMALDWLDLHESHEIEMRREQEARTPTGDGYLPRTGVLELPRTEREVARVTLLFEDYRIAPEEIRVLEDFARLDAETSTSVLLLEMPVHPDTINAYMGEDVYRSFNATVRAHAGGMLYWTTTDLNLIPDEGFVDSNHLNPRGSALFSRWLGERVGEAVAEGVLGTPQVRTKSP